MGGKEKMGKHERYSEGGRRKERGKQLVSREIL